MAMTRSKSKRYAYKDTDVPGERSIMQIETLLYKHGAVATQVNKHPEKRVIQFVFSRRVEVDGKAMQQPVRLEINYGARKPNEALRMMFYWLKAKFDAVDWGLMTFEEEFLPYFMGKLPSGEMGTIGEMMMPELRKGRLPPIEPLDGKQLPPG